MMPCSSFQSLNANFQFKTSEDSYDLAVSIMVLVDYLLKEDMLNQYYHLPERIYASYEEEWTLEDKRQDAAQTDDSSETEHDEEDIVTEDAETKQPIVNLIAIII